MERISVDRLIREDQWVTLEALILRHHEKKRECEADSARKQRIMGGERLFAGWRESERARQVVQNGKLVTTKAERC